MKFLPDTHIALWAILKSGQESDFIEIPLKYYHIFTLNSFSQKESGSVHKDPFDRLLPAQSITEKMSFMTHDTKIVTFDTNNILMV